LRPRRTPHLSPLSETDAGATAVLVDELDPADYFFTATSALLSIGVLELVAKFSENSSEWYGE
jgi:hypothetical protein